MKEPTIPQGVLKVLNIEDITWDKRYREDLGSIEELAESMKEKGVLQPITVSTDMQLLAGERRIRAATLAGLTKIPALVRKSEGPIDAREVELIENIFRKDFTWAEEAALIQEIDRLYREKHIAWTAKAGGGMQPGWSGRRTAELLNKSVSGVARSLQLAAAMEVMPELAEMKTADDAFKTIKKMEEQAITTELHSRQQASMNSGGLDKGITVMLRMAQNNYCIGDSFVELAALRSGGMVHVIECDPPYGIDLTKVKASKDSIGSTVHGYQDVAAESYPAFLEKLAKELYRVANQHCWLVFWFGPTWHHEVYTALTKAGWQVDDIPAVWIKEHGQTLQPEIYLARAYEPFFIARKGQPVLVKRGRLNVFNYPGLQGTQKIHPTERPVELIEEILSLMGLPQSIVLCPFLGSGNTIRAAYNLGMKVFGWDISPDYKPKFMLRVEEDARRLTQADTEEEEE